MKKVITLFSLCFINAMAICQSVSQFIHVDQFGYLTDQSKVAILSNPQVGYNSTLNYNPAPSLSVIDNVNNQVVFTGNTQVWNNGNTHLESGDKGWWFDFSSLSTPGEYYILDNLNNEKSAVFTIESDPYKDVLKHAGRMFYYNRCNTPKSAPYAKPKWIDGDNFNNALQDFNARYIYDQSNASLERDVSGGWFDAGDFNKYVTFTHSTIHNLLTAYEVNPAAFSDNWNIPESNNGVPDILDEIVWELRWLEKMQNQDGSVHIKAGSQNHNDNSSSPPSANTDQRFYGPICSSASAVVASVFAHASIVLKDFTLYQNYATILERKATLSFNYTLPLYQNNILETDCDDGSIVSGDADLSVGDQTNILIESAIYLFERNGRQLFQNFIVDNYQNSSIFASNYFNHYDLQRVDAFFRYMNLSNADAAVSNAFANLVNDQVTNNYESFYGFNDLDLYRAFVPSYSYHWGSNQPIANLGNLNLILAEHNILNNANDYLNKAADQVHYFHGSNPQGLSYLSNMYDYGAERSANEIYHQWFSDGSIYDHALNSPNGPAPGYVVGGSNMYFSNSNLTPPYGQPAQKSYLDFNAGYPESSWEITEPAIYYQAAYIRLLSYFVADQSTTSINTPIQSTSISIYPNPSSDYINVSCKTSNCDLSDYSLHIFDINGSLVLDINDPKKIDISSLSNGTLVLSLIHKKKGTIESQTFVKQ